MNNEQVDLVAGMSAYRFRGVSGLPLLDEPDLWRRLPTVEELSVEDPAGQWYRIMKDARVWERDEVVMAGSEILRMHLDIDAEIAARNIDLKRIEAGEEELPHDLAAKFTALHYAATKLAVGNIGLMQTALEKIKGWSELPDDMKAVLFSYGFEALVRAAKRYDPWYYDESLRWQLDAGKPFSTYAVSYVVGSMKITLTRKESEGMSMSIQARADLLSYRKAHRYLSQRLETDISHDAIVSTVYFRRVHKRWPEGRELVALFNNPEQYGEGGKADERFPYKSVRFERLIAASRVSRLDAERETQVVKPVADHHSGSFLAQLADLIVDPEVDTEDQATERVMQAKVRETLSRLPAREQRILSLRYGLFDMNDHTLEETARRMGLTRERVRQIEAQGLSRLRHPAIRRILRDYLAD